MKIRKITIAAAAAGLASTPVLSSAADASSVLDSCVKAFMADLSSRSASVLKLRDSRYEAAPDSYVPLQTFSSELTLTARDAHDNHAVGRAICTVNSHGEVIELRAAPLSDGVL